MALATVLVKDGLSMLHLSASAEGGEGGEGGERGGVERPGTVVGYRCTKRPLLRKTPWKTSIAEGASSSLKSKFISIYCGCVWRCALIVDHAVRIGTCEYMQCLCMCMYVCMDVWCTCACDMVCVLAHQALAEVHF